MRLFRSRLFCFSVEGLSSARGCLIVLFRFEEAVSNNATIQFKRFKTRALVKSAHGRKQDMTGSKPLDVAVILIVNEGP